MPRRRFARRHQKLLQQLPGFRPSTMCESGSESELLYSWGIFTWMALELVELVFLNSEICYALSAATLPTGRLHCNRRFVVGNAFGVFNVTSPYRG